MCLLCVCPRCRTGYLYCLVLTLFSGGEVRELLIRAWLHSLGIGECTVRRWWIQFDDLECRDLVHAGRADYPCCISVLHLSLQAAVQAPVMGFAECGRLTTDM